MTAGSWLSLAAIALFIALAGLMAASEVAITRTSRLRAHHLADEGARGATALVRVVDEPARHLNVVLLLTLMLHLGGTALATALAARTLGGLGEIVATLAMTVLLFVLAEVTPKTFTVLHTDKVALRLAPMIVALGRAFSPLARALIGLANLILPGKGLEEGPFVTEGEIRAMADAAVESKSIEEGDQQLIHSAFEFGDTVAREVIVPRPDMFVMDSKMRLREAIDLLIEHGYSRVPIFAGERDDIVGVVYTKDLLAELRAGNDPPLAKLARKPHFVPETKRIAELLREMQREKFHMAIVVDEYGSVAGLVTLEDLIEELVGDIVDEYDQDEPPLVAVGPDRYRINARLPVDELNELLELDLPLGEWDTVGGLVLGLLGRVPAAGERVELEGVRLTAERVDGRRIAQVLVERLRSVDRPDAAE